jgi:hypothetical protein
LWAIGFEINPPTRTHESPPRFSHTALLCLLFQPLLLSLGPASAAGNPSGRALVNAFTNVVAQTGLAWRLPRDPAVTQSQVVQVLDLTAVTQRNEDQGFYGIPFHPNFGLPGGTCTAAPASTG